MSYLKQTTKMGTWNARKLLKGLRGKQESGRSKGLVPPYWAKYCAKHGRAYRTFDRYADWARICDGNKVKWSSK